MTSWTRFAITLTIFAISKNCMTIWQHHCLCGQWMMFRGPGWEQLSYRFQRRVSFFVVCLFLHCSRFSMCSVHQMGQASVIVVTDMQQRTGSTEQPLLLFRCCVVCTTTHFIFACGLLFQWWPSAWWTSRPLTYKHKDNNMQEWIPPTPPSPSDRQQHTCTQIHSQRWGQTTFLLQPGLMKFCFEQVNYKGGCYSWMNFVQVREGDLRGLVCIMQGKYSCVTQTWPWCITCSSDDEGNKVVCFQALWLDPVILRR